MCMKAIVLCSFVKDCDGAKLECTPDLLILVRREGRAEDVMSLTLQLQYVGSPHDHQPHLNSHLSSSICSTCETEARPSGPLSGPFHRTIIQPSGCRE